MNKIINFLKRLLDSFLKASLLKKTIIIGIVFGLVMVGKGIFGGDEEAVKYMTETVSRETVAKIVSETGEIETTGRIEIASTIAGKVAEVYVQNGDQVLRGDDLFKVISYATAEERADAYGNYLKAKADLGTAKSNQLAYQADMFADWDDYMEIAESDSYDTDEERELVQFHIPQKDWLAAEIKYKNADQLVAQTQANLAEAWLDYQAMIDGVVKSPGEGIIANLAIAAGQEVDTSLSALMLKSSDEAWVKLTLNETDILTVEPGQTAKVEVDALRDSEFEGKVERVDEIGVVESGVVTYNVYLRLLEIDQKVKMGMTVQVEIETQKKENVLAVPNGAIKPYQAGRAVQIKDKSSDRLLYLPVKTGIVGPTMTEVLSGVDEGQEVIVSQNGAEEGSQGGGFRMFAH